MRRDELTDAQWKLIEPLLPKQSRCGRHTASGLLWERRPHRSAGTARQTHEYRHFDAGIATVRPECRKPIWIAGDKGYGYPRIRVWRARREIFDVIPLSSSQTKGLEHHGLKKMGYRGRNVVERTIGDLKENRRYRV